MALVVDAGSDQTAFEGDSIRLGGKVTGGGAETRWRWSIEQVSGDEVETSDILLTDVTVPSPSFVAPEAEADYRITFGLVAEDGARTSVKDTVEVTVGAFNDLPVLSVEPWKLFEEGEMVQVEGRGVDPEGRPVSLVWKLLGVQGGGVEVSQIALRDEGDGFASFIAPQGTGRYYVTLELQGSDGVKEANTTVDIEIAATNALPIANAGPDRTASAGGELQLDGKGSDPENLPLSYHWRIVRIYKEDGTDFGVSEAMPRLRHAQTSASVLEMPTGPMDYLVMLGLVVDDGEFESAEDTLVVSVKASDTAPRLTVNTGVEYSREQPTVLTAAMLTAVDGESGPEQIKFQVIAVPQIGYLKRDGVSLGNGTSFTMADINAGLVAFDPTGISTLTDTYFTFVVEDHTRLEAVEATSASPGRFELRLAAQSPGPGSGAAFVLPNVCSVHPDVTRFDEIGSGTQESPYIICRADQLRSLSLNCAENEGACVKHFRLGSDIDLQNVPFVPLSLESAGFSGVFDGNHHVIRNLKISYPTETQVGFFSKLIRHARVYDLRLEGVDVKGASDTGGLVGLIRANDPPGSCPKVYGVSVAGRVHGDDSDAVGGIVGTTSCNVSNATFTGTVSASRDEAMSTAIGLAAGQVLAGTFSGVDAVGDILVDGSQLAVGGLVGNLAGGTVRDGKAAAAVQISEGTTTSCIGGITGKLGSGAILNAVLSVSTFNPRASATTRGGIVGCNLTSNGSMSSGNAYYDKDLVAGVDTVGSGDNLGFGLSTGDLQKKSSYIGFAFPRDWVIDEQKAYPMLSFQAGSCEHVLRSSAASFAAIGRGTIEQPYLLCYPEQWQSYSERSCAEPCVDGLRLHADLDMKDPVFVAMGKNMRSAPDFAGTFDGAGHEMTGLAVAGNSSDFGRNIGLFRSLNDGAMVKNLTLDDFTMQGRERVGGIAGNIAGVVEVRRIKLRGKLVDVGFTSGGVFGTCDGTSSSFVHEARIDVDIGVKLEELSRDFGLIAGSAYGVSFIDVWATGKLTLEGGRSYRTVGGAFGGAAYSYVNRVMVNVQVDARQAHDGGSYFGGFTGHAADFSTFRDVVVEGAYLGDVTRLSNSGGFAGSLSSSANLERVVTSIDLARATPTQYGGFGGEVPAQPNCEGCFWNSDTIRAWGDVANEIDYETMLEATAEDLANATFYEGYGFTFDKVWRRPNPLPRLLWAD